jgi:hypothetical protein
MPEDCTYTVQLETTERIADEAILSALAQYLDGHQVLRDAALGLTPAGAVTVTCQVAATNIARAIKLAHEELLPLLAHWCLHRPQVVEGRLPKIVLVQAHVGVPE